MLIAMLLAAAELPAIFGLQLGAPVALPECRHRESSSNLYEENPAVICRTPVTTFETWHYPQGSVIFPIDKVPLLAANSEVTTFVIDGKLEGLTFPTHGPDVTDAIIQQLTEKFGRPTYVGDDVSNGGFNSFPPKQARWESPGLFVEYHNMTRNKHYGWVRIETAKAKATREQHEHAQAQQRVPL